jgi:hypothetical protein
MKEVVVTGGRDYKDYIMVNEILDFINPDTVIQGGASGADKLALEWAKANKKSFVTYEADWTKYGKRAGPIRNRLMLIEHPDAVVIAFPGGAGTANCVRTAVSQNMIVLEVK